jgi:Galactose-3-O-sulfotransferase
LNAEALAEIRALARERDQCIQDMLQELVEIKNAKGVNGDETLIAFVHIPKTAGGALHTMFVNAYSRTGIHNSGNYVTGPEKTVSKVAKPPGGWESWQHDGGRVAIGHTPYRVFRDHLPVHTQYITFLREPVDRVLSHYYRHVHLEGSSDGTRANRGQGKRAGSLEEALVQLRLPQLCNLSTRLLCSQPTLGKLPPSAVDEAKENLQRFVFVGIQERFEESVVLLQRTLGLGLVPYFSRHVSAPGRRPSVDEISDEERALVFEYNQFDAELYAFGRELFEQALAEAQEDVAADVQRLRDATASAVEEHEAAVKGALEWLDRELPPGGTEPMRDLIARAEAAGYPRAVLTEARRKLLVRKHSGGSGRPSFRRASSGSLTVLDDAIAWLNRELPAGAREPREALFERAEAAGVPREALKRARKEVSVEKALRPDGALIWSRSPVRL